MLLLKKIESIIFYLIVKQYERRKIRRSERERESAREKDREIKKEREKKKE